MQVTAPSGLSITVLGRTFELLQFHIHTPSEYTIDGRQFNGELHLVHADNQGNLVVIAVFFNIGATSNELLSQLAADPPAIKGQQKTLLSLDPSAILPSNRQYYHFNGSLTTPPATEGVKWFVLPNSVSITQADYDRLRIAIGGDNNRPLQALNGRRIVFDETT